MKLHRLFSVWLKCLPFTLFCLCAAAQGQDVAVTLTPAAVEVGAPELIHVKAKPNARIEGEWLGRKIEFFPVRGKGWSALGGVDVEAPVGPSTLKIVVHEAKGGVRDLSRTVEILPAHYKTASLDVSPEFVEPGAEAQKRIADEEALKKQVFATSAAKKLWLGSFRSPVRARPTDSFGTRRMFNGTRTSIHKGLDFRARVGTPVRAANSGTVVLARPLYFEGNCVVIDHGLGLYTLSMHLNRVDVHEGQSVRLGQRIGLSGATGRVTGPHLHWAVRWQGAYLDPAKLLRMNLATAH